MYTYCININSVTLRILQGSFLLFVEVSDDDTFPPDDTVANIFVEQELLPSSSFTLPEFFTAANARLELSFRVQCNSGFTGPDCTQGK